MVTGSSDGLSEAGAKEKETGLGRVVLRNEFYRDGYRNLLQLTLALGLVIIGLIGCMFFVVKIHQPENIYFATTEDGRLVPMVPLRQPNLSTPADVWVAQSATKVMTFGFNDFRRRLRSAPTCRSAGNFTSALKIGIIEMVEANQQVVTAAPQGAPILQSEGLSNDRYQWIATAYGRHLSSGGKNTLRQSSIALVIVRVPRLESRTVLVLNSGLPFHGKK